MSSKSMREGLKREIKPKSFIEHMYVEDVANILWDIMRLRRFKADIINNRFRAALEKILEQVLCEPKFQFGVRDKAERLAHDWFHTQKANNEVAKLLRQYQLDEHSIAAEAFRQTAQDMDRLDRMLTLAEVRRDRALRSIAEYRLSLATRVRQSLDQILDNDEVPRLVAVAKPTDWRWPANGKSRRTGATRVTAPGPAPALGRSGRVRTPTGTA